MYDAGAVALMLVLALTAGIGIGAWLAQQHMGGSIDASEVDRRTAPPGPPAR